MKKITFRPTSLNFLDGTEKNYKTFSGYSFLSQESNLYIPKTNQGYKAVKDDIRSF